MKRGPCCSSAEEAGDTQEFGAEKGRTAGGHGTHSGSLLLRSPSFLPSVSPFNLQYAMSISIPGQCKQVWTSARVVFTKENIITVIFTFL